MTSPRHHAVGRLVCWATANGDCASAEPDATRRRRGLGLDSPLAGCRMLCASRRMRPLHPNRTGVTMSISTVKFDGVVAEYLAAVNAFDEDAVMAAFAGDALVN